MTRLLTVPALVTILAVATAPPVHGQGRCEAARIALAPRIVRLEVGAQQRVTATAYDARGIPCADSALQWASSNLHVARVAAGGLVSGVAPGLAIVTVRGRGTPPAVATVFVGDVERQLRGLERRELRPPFGVMVAPLDTLFLRRDRELPPFRGTPDSTGAAEYARMLALRLALTVSLASSTFRNTAGAPVAGATSPDVLSSRERSRWERCGELAAELRSATVAVRSLRQAGAARPPALVAALGELDSALGAAEGVQACTQVARLIREPQSAERWEEEYRAAASRVYERWYAEVEAISAASRAVLQALGAGGYALPPRQPAPMAVVRFGPRERWLTEGVPSAMRWGGADAAAARAGADTTVLGPAAVGAVRRGQKLPGVLQEGDRTMGDGSFADLWGIAARAGERLVVELRSTAFDAYLQFLDPDGNRIAEDDDGLGRQDSRVVVEVPRDGRYWIVVTTYSPRTRAGFYTLGVR